MQGAVETVRLRNARREAEYDSWVYERLKTDEITQASEQLNGAMKNSFEYCLVGDELYFQGESLTPIFDRGTDTAWRLMTSSADFTVEYVRRLIERRQLTEQINLRKNVDWSEPDVLVHISPTPDAVLDGTVRMNAYDTERKKIMIRITEPTRDGVKVTSISLDGNNRIALQSVGDSIGITIPDDATSEDILAMSGLVSKSTFRGREPSDVLRDRYDNAMAAQYGGRWYAGRQDSDVSHTIDRINAQPHIVDEHVSIIAELKRRYGTGFRESLEYKKANHNFLAAIHYASNEGSFHGSLSDAGGRADAEGVEFSKPDCPTDVMAEEALAEQGIGNNKEMKCVECPFCHRIVDAKIGGGIISCPQCFKAVDKKGKVFDIRKRSEPNEKNEKTINTATPKPLSNSLARRAFGGMNVIIKSEIEIGGGSDVVYDETNTIIAKIRGDKIEYVTEKEQAALAA